MPLTFDMLTVPNLAEAISDRLFHTVTFWNRLEGRPRAEKFDRALKAEVRDALWMLTKQWQMGEFRGDDAGSPAHVKLRMETTRIRQYRPDGAPYEPFDETVPLEAQVERQPVAFRRDGADLSLDLRLLMGRQWLKLIAGLGDFAAGFRATYPIHQPDPTRRADAAYCAHPDAWSAYAAVAGRRMDGAALYFYLKADPGHHAYDGIAGLAGQEAAVDAAAARFVAWFERLIYQPAGADAWTPDRLEYQFSVAAPVATPAGAAGAVARKVLTAEEYYHGHLDWYNLDVDSQAQEPDNGEAPEPLPARETQVLLPTQVTFGGMPNTRWWAFEDGRTNFGDVRPDTTDLAKLLLIEFGLLYANDWFQIPYTLPVGSIATIKGLAVTNVFGERTWVQAAGRGADDDWQRWAMFNLSTRGRGNEPADLSLVLLPTAAALLESEPLEQVMLVRDEIANMVWGIERTVPLPTGEGKRGREAADETRVFFEKDLERRLGAPPAPPLPAAGAKIRYQVMSSVPENWIPFIPVHVPGDNRRSQLQRAAMPRVLEGDARPPRKIRPRTGLLRAGLDQPVPAAYILHEEEVPRAGVQVTQRFQRTRWRDGRAWVWLGVRKQTGRGEGSSGLAFDRIIDVPPPAEA
jgi:hypothetical protein